MLFRTKKHFYNCQHIVDKNGPMELDADEARKFQGPPDRILGQPTWGGGGRQNFGGVGGGEKRRFSLEKRDLSALAPFKAEANLAQAS